MNNYADIQQKQVDEQTAADVAELFRALGDTSRIQMLVALLSGEQNVGSLAERAGISESATSHHLRHLRQMRLVRTRKEGRHVIYMLDDDHIVDLLRCGVDHVKHG